MARKAKRPGKPDYRAVYLFAVLGVGCFVVGVLAAYNGLRTLRWPHAQAEIIEANLKVTETERRNQREPDKTHTFSVRYIYVVDGQRYLGHKIEPDDLGMQNSGGAVTMANTYQVGTKTEIAYDPSNPAVAYLKPGPSSFSLALIGIGAGLVLVSGLMRRMIRLGPGEDKEDKAPAKTPVKKEIELDPAIASFYPKRDDKQAQP